MTNLLSRWREPLGPDQQAQAQDGRVDVCVIGSGAGGAPVALALARAGYRVVVLEKGPALGREDFLYDEIRSCRRDLFVPSPAEEPHVEVPPAGRARTTSNGWTANCVGGGTVHFSGFTYRLHPEDLKLRSLLGAVPGSTLCDWPLAWAQLEPYYEIAEAELGISGDAQRNPFETARRPLPLPPLPESGVARLVDAACARLGLHSYPTARAILSAPYQGRGPCERSAFCGSYGCHTGAKSSVLAALWPKALATGRCQIRPGCMVHGIETDESGRATAVRYLDYRRQQQRVAAAVVVVACSAVESARLLLLSRGKAHPQGLGNAHGQVGQNLMFCGLGLGQAEFPASDAAMQAIDWREPFINRSFQDLYVMGRGTDQQRKGGTVNFLLPHGNPIHRAEQLALDNRGAAATLATGGPLWGQALKDAIRRAQEQVRTVEFEIYAETLPHPGAALTLDDEVKDKWGLPVARFSLASHREDAVANRALLDKGLEVLREMGGQDVRVTRREEKNFVLQGGTCRFGTDPRTSVLDPDCRVHDAPNVFVTDGSFMPTLGGVPNTLTIQANAFRVADRIIALGKRHDLLGRGRPAGR